MSYKLSSAELELRANGVPKVGILSQFENGNFVDYFAPMIDEIYVTDPETGSYRFTTEHEAEAGAKRYQKSVRERLANTST